MPQLIDHDRLAAARAHAARVPLDEIDVIHFDLHQQDLALPYFERLRRETRCIGTRIPIAAPSGRSPDSTMSSSSIREQICSRQTAASCSRTWVRIFPCASS